MANAQKVRLTAVPRTTTSKTGGITQFATPKDQQDYLRSLDPRKCAPAPTAGRPMTRSQQALR